MSGRKKRKITPSSAISSARIVSDYFTDESNYESKMPLIVGERINASFYDQTCEDFAKCLLGKMLVRKMSNGSLLKGIIVETESYLGGDDAASKSCKGKITPGNEPMFMAPGTAYVYFTYGMYHCFNISCKGEGAAVLLRAVEPLEGVDEMQKNRLLFTDKMKVKRMTKLGLKGKIPDKKQDHEIKLKDLCNGPSKLCISFDIDIVSCNKCNLIDSDHLWLEKPTGFENSRNIVEAPRIGIDSAGPIWAKKLLRFYFLDSEFVSRRNKHCENELKLQLCSK